MCAVLLHTHTHFFCHLRRQFAKHYTDKTLATEVKATSVEHLFFSAEQERQHVARAFQGGGRMMANGSDFTELKENTLTHLKKLRLTRLPSLVKGGIANK